MRTRWIAALVAGLVVIAAGVVIVVHVARHGHSGSTRAGAQSQPVPTVTSTRPTVLTPVSTTASPAAADAVADRLRLAAASTALGSSLAGVVVDADTGAVLWQRDADQPSTPASTTKLLTSTVALRVLGPSFRFRTTTVRSGHTVYLVGGGDVTLSRTAHRGYPTFATMTALARSTAAALSGAGTVQLRYDTSAWSGPARAVGWHEDYGSNGDITPPSPLELDEGRISGGSGDTPRVSDPAMQAATAFASLLRADGVHLRGRPSAATAPTSATALAAVSSPPLAALVSHLLTVSDNDLAEALGRALAVHAHLPATFVGAQTAVVAGLRALGVPTTGVTLEDTSGLSYRDRIPPVTLADVVRLDVSAAQPELSSIAAGLPVAGFTGTLSDRYRSGSADAAAGVLRAKTGTLNNVDTLAGFVVDRDGRLLAFALMADKTAGPGVAEPPLDRLASRLVGCGCG